MGAALLLCAATATAQSSRAQPKPKRPVAGPEVTALTVRPIKTRVGEACPATFTVHGQIQTNGATTVTYTWVSANGRAWPQTDLTFKAAGTKSVSEKWTLGAAGKTVDEWIQLEVRSPNRMQSSKVALAFTCAK